mmetsp:Transcript_2281/g.3107  ORF Transcript_2281/g.3107 Transcript_2281/m.3107 type:complete len:134 (+) Transcript_2281:72-473(+)
MRSVFVLVATVLALAATTALSAQTSLRASVKEKWGISMPKNDCAKACVAKSMQNAPDFRTQFNNIMHAASIDPVDWAKEGITAGENAVLGPQEIKDCFSGAEEIGSGILNSLLPGSLPMGSSGCIIDGCNDKC